MDVLNPELEEIDGSIYRLNVNSFSVSGKRGNAEVQPYIEYGDDNDEIEDITEKIVNGDDFEDEYHRIRFHVAKIFLPHIIGQRGSTLQRLKLETKTDITVPNKNEDGEVVISGMQKINVMSAYRRIQIMISTARQKQPITHFISIPANTDEIKEKFVVFKQSVLNVFGHDRGISENIFQKPEKLHLTAGVFVLADNVERKQAVDVLKKCKELFADSIQNKIVAHIWGVESMNDDPTEVHVLFAKVVNSNALQQFIDKIVNFFYEAGILLRKDRDNVKLHVTLINTKFSEVNHTNFETRKCRQRPRVTFDARNILQNYRDFDFGEMEIDSVHLSQMHTTSEDGYYAPSFKITF